ncbi:hypothetical protein Back2_28530 [Nocardioides baekrokdamisoli]|uniref:Uncharacterized protein n=1 Tax=Nocardioides baekrokdamisoli TaxID=1804624 RepID=A0A3G9IJU9_9ACTN|nr:hypothetical protein Back2_28530 [Nocardioides baekrokdamisoli]
MFGLASWFLTVPWGESTVEMFTGRKPEPGSRRYRRIRVARWLGLALPLALAATILVHWI